MKKLLVLIVMSLAACGPSKEELDRRERDRLDSLKQFGIVEPPQPASDNLPKTGMNVEAVVINGCTYVHDKNCQNH